MNEDGALIIDAKVFVDKPGPDVLRVSLHKVSVERLIKVNLQLQKELQDLKEDHLTV